MMTSQKSISGNILTKYTLWNFNPIEAPILHVLLHSFVESVLDYMKEQKRVHKKYVLKVLFAALAMYKNTPTLMRINIERPSSIEPETTIVANGSQLSAGGKKGKITVCGDTHGQYYDLLNIFKLAGLPSDENPFLFNGDYVDRGSFSFEVIFALLCIKVASPTAVYLLRGNHETKLAHISLILIDAAFC